LVLGSIASPLARRFLPVRAVLLLELWASLGCGVFLVWPSVYVLAAGILPAAIAIPSTDSVVHGYRIAMTPDRLLGRAESVRTMTSLLIAPLGPLTAGVRLGAGNDRRVHGGQPDAGAVGHAQPVDPGGPQPRRAPRPPQARRRSRVSRNSGTDQLMPSGTGWRAHQPLVLHVRPRGVLGYWRCVRASGR
jgi:hypothetical protein